MQGAQGNIPEVIDVGACHRAQKMATGNKLATEFRAPKINFLGMRQIS